VVAADRDVLRHVAAGLAQEPDRSAVCGQAEARTNETAAVGPGSRVVFKNRRVDRGLLHWGHCPILPVGVSV
jgi:hypothetical protein